jgi:hypothetical protein
LKKFIYFFIFLFAVTSITQAQSSRIKSFKPSLQIMLKGAYSVPLSHQDFKDFTSGFPGAQFELVYDFNPCWGVYGNFSADFISAKTTPVTLPGSSTEIKTSTQLTGYVGPRYYINLRSAPLWKILLDAGVGLYSFKSGDRVQTLTTNPPVTTTYSYSSYSQFGTNLGASASVVVSSRAVINFGAKYHFVFKKTGGTFTETSSAGPSNTYTTNFAERSYLQFMVGFGFRLIGDDY